MKKRRPKARATFEAIQFENVARLVTLEDPDEDVEEARGAFARIRPPVDHPPDAITAWRGKVSQVARAVRVVPPPRSIIVPSNAKRADPEADVVAEALAIACETKDTEVVALVQEAFDQAKGRR